MSKYKQIRKGTGQSYMRNSELKKYLEDLKLLKKKEDT